MNKQNRFKTLNEAQPKDGQIVMCKCQNSGDIRPSKYHNDKSDEYPLGYFTIDGEIIVFGLYGRDGDMWIPK